MFRVINTVHRIRPRSKIRSPVVRLGGSRIGPKKAKVFTKEFVYHHLDEFVSSLNYGEIKVFRIKGRQVMSSDDLLTAVLSAGSAKKAAPAPKPVKPKPATKSKASKKEPAKKAASSSKKTSSAKKAKKPAKKTTKKTKKS
jgi:hypothetical protein